MRLQQKMIFGACLVSPRALCATQPVLCRTTAVVSLLEAEMLGAPPRLVTMLTFNNKPRPTRCCKMHVTGGIKVCSHLAFTAAHRQGLKAFVYLCTQRYHCQQRNENAADTEIHEALYNIFQCDTSTK